MWQIVKEHMWKTKDTGLTTPVEPLAGPHDQGDLDGVRAVVATDVHGWALGEGGQIRLDSIIDYNIQGVFF